jgi:hypothetical protein
MSTTKYQFQKLSRQELGEEAHHPPAAVQKRRRTLVPFNSKEEQHTFLPSWNDSDFTMPLEQYTFDPSWIDSDFIMPQEQHIFNPSWINADFAIPVGNFTDANIQARSEADHDDNRLPDLGLKVMISNTPSEITPRQQTSHGRLTETRRQPKTL